MDLYVGTHASFDNSSNSEMSYPGCELAQGFSCETKQQFHKLWKYLCDSKALQLFLSNLAPLQVPRIHALLTRPLHASVRLPAIMYKTSTELQYQVRELRSTVLTFLQKVFGGDDVVAELFLLQLLSR